MTRKLIAFVVLAIVLGLPGLSQAQAFYIVDYFDNANNPAYSDATVRITNVGLTPGTGTGVGDQCALIYVWDHDQQLAERKDHVAAKHEAKVQWRKVQASA